MNMNDLMKIGAGIVLVGSVCESAMCHDYKGAQLVHGLYDLGLENNIADLTVEKIKADGGDWSKCTLGSGVSDVAKAIYNGGNWANGTVAFEGLTNEAKILVYGIAKATKDHESEDNNAGWQFFTHMFKSAGLAGDADGIASVLNAWGEFARGEAFGWKRYQDLGDKAGIDAEVLDYSKSAWRCCGMVADSMLEYIEYIDDLVQKDNTKADVSDSNFDLAEISKIAANGKRLVAAVTKGGEDIWDVNAQSFKAGALAEWKKVNTGEERQKAIAADFINHMGGKVIGKKVQSGYEASACFEESAVKVVEGLGGKAARDLQGQVNKAKSTLSEYTARMKKIQKDAGKYCKINLMNGEVTALGNGQ